MKYTKNCDGSFTIPCKWDLGNIVDGDEKVVVVAVVGYSEPEENGDKTGVLRLLLGCDMSQCNPLKPLQIGDSLVHLEGWYDSCRHVVYLHLVSVKDAALLCGGVKVVDDLYQEKDCIEANSLLERQYMRALLLVLSVSHLVIWTHTTHVFNVSIIDTIKELNTMRTSLLPHLSSCVESVGGAGSQWGAAGRLCCPRMLFIFSSRNINIDELMQEVQERKPFTRQEALRNQERSLEDQLYRLFRRTWIITNNSAQSAVALASNHPFVYMPEEHQLQQATTAANLTAAPAQQANRGADLLRVGLCEGDNVELVGDSGGRKKKKAPLDLLALHLLQKTVTDVTMNTEHRFSTFLLHHINVAFNGGFDDNVGRGHGSPVFVLPRMGTWVQVTNKLYQMIVRPETSEKIPRGVLDALSVQMSHVKVMRELYNEMADQLLQLYDKSLPDYYPAHVHNVMMSKIIKRFEYSAGMDCGKIMSEWRDWLVKGCEAKWRDGKQGCEQLSLTGHACQKQKDHESVSKDDVASSGHTFGSVFHKYCNCGHSGGKQRDSCDLRHMNEAFYAALSVDCCDYLETYQFPSIGTGPVTVRLDATGNKDGGEDFDGLKLSGLASITASLSRRLNIDDEEGGGDSDGSYTAIPETPVIKRPKEEPNEENPLWQEVADPDENPYIEGDVNTNYSYMGGDGTDSSGASADERMTIESISGTSGIIRTQIYGRIHSQHEDIAQTVTPFGHQLDPMLCSNSPADFLPLYSSWSLVCIGPSFLYSHNIGIVDQPGYLTGSNYLLPWDVKIKVTNKHDWTIIADNLKKSKGKLSLASDEFSVKVFLGCEYECRRGHRFLMSSPQSVLVSQTGHPTTPAADIATQPMPLYHPCLCSESKEDVQLGQLMRLHVVTPKAPVSVMLNPAVQPGPSPCPRYVPQPTSSAPIRLSAASYWVLRLPNIYTSPSGPHFPDPSEHVGVFNGCLLPGCFTVSEVNIYR